MISIVIPTYQSAKFIEKTFTEIHDFATGENDLFEIVWVDDGSRDDTFAILNRLAATESTVPMTILQLAVNRGQFHALMAGFSFAIGDFVVTLDDDLEYLPGEIDKLLQPFQSDPDAWDVVIGVPQGNKRNWFRELGTWANNAVNSVVFDKPRRLRSGAFRMMTREFAQRLIEYRTANPVMGSLIFRATVRIANVPVSRRKGLRPSNYSPGSLGRTLLGGMQNFSEIPLRYISRIGLTMSILSFLVAVFVIQQYMTGFPWEIRFPGWTSLIVSIWFLSGVILFSLGFIGQYIFRVLEEVNKSPNYQIRNQATYSVEKTETRDG